MRGHTVINPQRPHRRPVVAKNSNCARNVRVSSFSLASKMSRLDVCRDFDSASLFLWANGCVQGAKVTYIMVIMASGITYYTRVSFPFFHAPKAISELNSVTASVLYCRNTRWLLLWRTHRKLQLISTDSFIKINMFVWLQCKQIYQSFCCATELMQHII